MVAFWAITHISLHSKSGYSIKMKNRATKVESAVTKTMDQVTRTKDPVTKTKDPVAKTKDPVAKTKIKLDKNPSITPNYMCYGKHVLAVYTDNLFAVIP